MPSFSTPAYIHSTTKYLVSDGTEASRVDLRISLSKGGGNSELSRTIKRTSFCLNVSVTESEKSRMVKEDFILFSDLKIAHKNDKRKKK